jgi:sugar lactone lactonase YvrE
MTAETEGAIRVAAASQNALGESPLWHRASGCLLWLDVKAATLWSFEPQTGRVEERALALPPPVSALVATIHPGVFAVAHAAGVSLLNPENGEIRDLYDPEQGREDVLYNDMKVDQLGRLWVGTCDAFYTETRGVLWCCAPGGAASLADDGFAVSNGPAFSPDGKILYLSDSATRRILRYTMNGENCHLHARSVFYTFRDDEGYPDGLTVDSEGCLWAAHWGGGRVSRIAPNGTRLQSFDMPAPNVTSLCFGADDFKTLYVTSGRDGLSDEMLKVYPASGSLFSFKPGPTGLPEPLFSPV